MGSVGGRVSGNVELYPACSLGVAGLAFLQDLWGVPRRNFPTTCRVHCDTPAHSAPEVSRNYMSASPATGLATCVSKPKGCVGPVDRCHQTPTSVTVQVGPSEWGLSRSDSSRVSH